MSLPPTNLAPTPDRGWLGAALRTRRGGLAGALLVRVVLFSTLVTLVLTIMQLTLSYRSERTRLETRLDEIERASAGSLAESLWALDARQIEAQVQGILRLPSIRAVEVREDGPQGRGFSMLRGERLAGAGLTKDVPLVCCGDQPQHIGVLHIEATLSDILKDLLTQAVVILLSNAAKTFVVAFFILFVVHRVATRHLLDLAQAVGDDTRAAELAPLRLQRAQVKGDELDRLVEALNSMRGRLKQKATELGNANARMAALLDNIPDFAWVKDLEGRFIVVNRAYASAKGIADPAELVGKTDRDIHPAELAEAYRRDDADVIASGQVKRLEERHVNADGSTVMLETVRTALRDAAGRVVGTVGIARDISDRRQAEADREARQVAELANRAKGEYLAHMSHEIRTPMNIIIGMSYLAERSGLNAEQRGYVQKIHAAATMLLGVINDILDFSKIEAGRLDIETIPFDLPGLLDEVTGLLAVTAQDKGLAIRLALAPGLPREVTGDPARLRQVLLNLGSNAVKFTPSGQVTVAVEAVERTAASARLRFEVRDTGVGMAPDVLRKLFQPFTQADPSTQRQYGGTGLGLTISRHLVQLMGGEIDVSSTPGVGSTFHFELPFDLPTRRNEPVPAAAAGLAAAATAHGGQAREPGRAPLAGVHVLLVEDNPINTEIGLALLQGYGARVTVAGDGREALGRLEGGHFDAVLMDCQMPVMDGYEATRRLRQDPRWREIPVIAMTANALLSDRDAALAAGMNDHIPKPINPRQLLDVLLRWIGPPGAGEDPRGTARDATKGEAA